ncbi:MAG: hypothetical protein ACR2MS_05835 [Weeksellaceae bacterium]
MKTKELLIQLNDSVGKLLKEIKLRDEKIDNLNTEITNLKQELSKSQANLKVTENKNNELKVISGLSGNREHRRLMKLKLNSLIKEVDICIAALKEQKV